MEKEELNEYRINDVCNSFNLLTYDEKKAFINRTFGFRLLTVPDLDNRLVLVSLLNAIFRAYKKNHPEETMDAFIPKLLKDKLCDLDKEWFVNFLPFAESLAEGCDKVNTFGLKTAGDFKNEICKILNLLLPF